MAVFPFMQKIDGKRFLVVGAGAVARRKIRLLLQFTDQISVITHPSASFAEKQETEIREELASLSDSGVKIYFRKFKEEDLHKAEYCIASSDDNDLNHRIASLCHAADIPVNVPDNPADCTFFMPSVIKKGPLVITVSTEGASPAMSSEIRSRIEEILPSDTEEILERMEELRSWVPQCLVSSRERGMLYKDLLSSLLDGRLQPIEADVRAAALAWMESNPCEQNVINDEIGL